MPCGYSKRLQNARTLSNRRTGSRIIKIAPLAQVKLEGALLKFRKFSHSSQNAEASGPELGYIRFAGFFSVFKGSGMGADRQPRFRKLYLEITNICNIQCSFCPAVERKAASLDMPLIESFFQKVSGWADRVCLHVMGEPTSHPQFPDFVEKAKQYGLQLEITTNGLILNDAVKAALLSTSVVQVNFSLQSFFDNFPEKDPGRYLEKIFAFTQQAMSARPDLYINFRLWNIGSADDRDVSEFVLQKIESAFSVQLNRSVDPGFKKSKRVKDRVYLHFDSRFNWPDISSPVLGTQGRCHGTVSHLAVHSNGDVVPCCLDKEATIKLGNLSKQSLQEIVSSERYLNMVQGFNSGVLVEDLCQRCEYIQRFN